MSKNRNYRKPIVIPAAAKTDDKPAAGPGLGQAVADSEKPTILNPRPVEAYFGGQVDISMKAGATDGDLVRNAAGEVLQKKQEPMEVGFYNQPYDIPTTPPEGVSPDPELAKELLTPEKLSKLGVSPEVLAADIGRGLTKPVFLDVDADGNEVELSSGVGILAAEIREAEAREMRGAEEKMAAAAQQELNEQTKPIRGANVPFAMLDEASFETPNTPSGPLFTDANQVWAALDAQLKHVVASGFEVDVFSDRDEKECIRVVKAGEARLSVVSTEGNTNKPTYPRGQTPYIVHFDDAGYVPQFDADSVKCPVCQSSQGCEHTPHERVTARMHQVFGSIPLMEDILTTLEYTESVYRLNVVKDGTPSAMLENLQRVIKRIKDTTQPSQALALEDAKMVGGIAFHSPGEVKQRLASLIDKARQSGYAVSVMPIQGDKPQINVTPIIANHQAK